ncbi:MAG: hypothetical protein Q9227_004474 [Pyrenula ochraceoflavens]
MSNSDDRRYRIGIDVGGTNTDAVVIDPTIRGVGVLAACKTPTTADVTEAIRRALREVLEVSKIPKDQIACVIIGTTSFINAVIERDARRLAKVAVIRLSKSFLRDIPPFSGFPIGLERICNGYLGYVDGGLAIDGSEEAPLDEDQVRKHCLEIKKRGITAIVVVGVFSPIDEVFQQESRVECILRQELPHIDVVVSHRVANIGFKERENASILNAAILQFARRTVKSFKAAVHDLELSCPLYLTQNDGTISECSHAAEFPIRTFSSGATNSMRGAAYLASANTDRQTATIVIDVGGTTTDVGVLEKTGFPRQAPSYVKIAGIGVNYSMPLLHSIGLGGGSIIRQSEGDGLTVGPDSVGHRLTSKSRAFGGSILTATDISVARGLSGIGSPKLVADITPETIDKIQEQIRRLLEQAVDAVKTSPEPLPVLLVGGGSIISNKTIKGASALTTPPYFDVANAVGAAISKVGGTVDIVQNTSNQSEKKAIDSAMDLAMERAVKAGACLDSLSIVEIESIPLQYVSNQVRTIVKAVGDLQGVGQEYYDDDNALQSDMDEASERELEKLDAKFEADHVIDIALYRPRVSFDEARGVDVWHINEIDLQFLSIGMYVLGCAGGGQPASTETMLKGHLREGHSMRVIDASSLRQSDKIYWGGHMGSPAVSVERLAATETVSAVHALMSYLGDTSFDAIMGLEIGGGNGLEPFLLGSSKYFDRPVIDADWMGRAFPTYHQTTLVAHESGQLTPCAIDSGSGNSVIMTRTSNDRDVDRILRASCTEMGSRVGMAARPTTADRVQRYGVLNTCSLAWRIGRCIELARQTNTLSTVAEAIVDEAGGPTAAKVLFRGKIVAVERRLHKGHSYGEVLISAHAETDTNTKITTKNIPAATHRQQSKPLAQDGHLRIPFKNENILAEHHPFPSPSPPASNNSTNNNNPPPPPPPTILVTVPDLIAVLDSGDGRALGVPEYKYGVSVVVLGITCSPRWVDVPKALELGGPAAFGFEGVEYRALGVYKGVRSVVEEFGTGGRC